MLIESLEESLVFDRTEFAPQQFQKMINTIANRLDAKDFKDVEITDEDVVIRFGEPSLPSEHNTVHIGGKFLNKASQSRMLKGVVPTITTYNDYIDILGDKFLAKKKSGQKQIGQLDGVRPEDATDYIFQPKVKIVKEFRIVVFYINGRYHVSGIYEKTGSNASFRSIPLKKGDEIVQMSIAATKALKYGFAGVDLAIVHNKDALHIQESFMGKLASLAITDLGSTSDVLDAMEEHIPVILEVNSFPSMGNPAIAHDLLQAIQKEAS